MTAVPVLTGDDRAALPGVAQIAIGRGWQRAIDKAQAAAWFRGALSPGNALPATRSAGATSVQVMNGTTGLAASATDAHGATEAPVVPEPFASRLSGEMAPAVGSACSSTGAVVVPGAARPAEATATIGPLATPWCPTSRAVDVAVDEPIRRVPDRAMPVPSEGRSLRVHVEQQADGLHVWVGAPWLATDALVRQLDLSGLHRVLPDRLVSLVCNGVSIQGGPSAVFRVTSPGSAGHNQEP